jgi:hypothetical protein
MRRAKRLDDVRVRARGFGGFAHGREIHHQRHPGHVLQQHARHHQWHFFCARRLGPPAREAFQMRFGDFLAVAVP